MQTRLIVGFCGAIEAGKTTCAKMLADVFGNDAKLYSFADALKEECTSKFDLDKSQFGYLRDNDWSGPKTSLGRKILQDHGAEVRSNHPNHWLELIQEKVKKDQKVLAIIQDMRYTNEVGWIRNNGTIVYIRRECMERRFIDDYISSKKAPHCSELEWRLWLWAHPNEYITISNNDTLERLEKLMIKSFLYPEVKRRLGLDAEDSM